MGFIQKEKEDLSNIWNRLKHRDFSGNAGMAIKNSTYQLLTNLISKLGGFILTIILARLLMPELFGLYNLALSTILLFTSLSNLGIGNALIKFLPSEILRKNLNKARSYLHHIRKFRMVSVLISITILLTFSKYIADSFYNKPILWALWAGALYILFYNFSVWLQSILQAFNNFKGVFLGETSFQISRTILVPIAVLISLKYSQSNQLILFILILTLAIAYLVASLILILFHVRKTKVFLSSAKSLDKPEKKKVNTFLAANIAMSFSGIFFGYIDKIMLGHFVAAEFIGYYTAALSLLTSVTALMGFNTALLPLFSRMNEKEVNRGLEKSIRNILLFSVILFIGTLVLSHLAIRIIYGNAYNPSSTILQLLSPLIFLLPLIGIYSSYFLSRGRPWAVSNLLVTATVINIVLNYIFITSLLKYGSLIAVYGAGAATVISQAFYLASLLFFSKRRKRKMNKGLSGQ